jgi:hypothetical protein
LDLCLVQSIVIRCVDPTKSRRKNCAPRPPRIAYAVRTPPWQFDWIYRLLWTARQIFALLWEAETFLRTSPVPRLEHLDWRVDYIISSSNLKDVAAPSATLKVRVRPNDLQRCSSTSVAPVHLPDALRGMALNRLSATTARRSGSKFRRTNSRFSTAVCQLRPATAHDDLHTRCTTGR